MLSVLELFRIGIGPSSSHTLGPIRICRRFLEDIVQHLPLASVSRIVVELKGSLALTGQGHDTPMAILLGLVGIDPETVDPDEADAIVTRVLAENKLSLLQRQEIAFNPTHHIVFAYGVIPELHLRLEDSGRDSVPNRIGF